MSKSQLEQILMKGFNETILSNIEIAKIFINVIK